MIAIVDYGMGNVGSIRNMLRKIGAPAVLTGDPAVVAGADKIILPGVGAFDEGMRRLEEGGLLNVLHDRAAAGTPVLGICLGMQLLFERSAEGARPGLGWLAGEVLPFRFDPPRPDLKVPHMGWNTVTVSHPAPLFAGLDDGTARFYFVHTYHAACADPADVLATAHHGYDFAAAVRRGAVAGTQFHPEKSHRFGMRLLRNFAEGC